MTDITEKLEEIRNRIGENCGQIVIRYAMRYDGPDVEAKAYVSVPGEDSNIVGPGFGSTVEEAVENLIDFIAREEELWTWPWWSTIHQGARDSKGKGV